MAKNLDRDIDDALALRELESTAADYVGAAKARAMAKSGYFKRQLARERSTRAAPAAAPSKASSAAYSEGVADAIAGRPHAPTDHPEYVAGYAEGKRTRAGNR